MTERTNVHRQLYRNKDAIIDGHVHAGTDATNVVLQRYPTAQNMMDIVRKMDASGVDYAATFPMPSDLFWFDASRLANNLELVPSLEPAEAFPYQRSNWSHFHEAKLFGDGKILPFAIILPGVKEEEQINSLRTYINQDSVFGLKFHTFATQTHASALKDSKFIRLAQEHSLPITVHSGSDELSDPQQVIELAKLYPDVRFCIAHAADFKKDIFMQLAQNPSHNLFIDTCPHISNCYLAQREDPNQLLELNYADPKSALLGLYQQYPQGVIWGTDEPWTTITDDKNQTILAKVMYEDEASLLKQLPNDVRKQISYINTVRFLFGDNRPLDV